MDVRIAAATVRCIGLGRLLASDAVQYAREQGIAAVDARMTTEQRDARAMFEGLWFSEAAVLPQHIRDRDGRSHDLVVMSFGVEQQ